MNNRSNVLFRLSSSEALATVVGVFALALAAASLLFAQANRDLPIDEVVRDAPKWFGTQNAISAVAFLIPGWYIAVKAPRMPFGWLLLAGAIGHGLAGSGWGYLIASEVGGGNYPVPWLAPLLSAPGTGIEVPILAAVLTFYPDGKRPPGWIGWLGIAAIVLGSIGVLAAILDPFTDLARDPNSALGGVRNPIGTTLFSRFDQGGVVFMAPAGIIPGLVIIVRWLRARGEMRQLLRWIALGDFAGAIFAPLVLLGGEWFLLSVQLPTVLVLAVLVAGSLRNRVYGIEVVVSRAFLYFALLAVVAGIYGAIIGGMTLLAGQATETTSFIAAVAAAFALAPLRGRIERFLNRMLFGQRDDPYQVISRVSAELAEATDELLPAFASQVASALRVPFVAIEYGDAGDRRVMSVGESQASSESFPLIQQGVDAGRLRVGHRSGEREFTPAERQLLGDLARQASATLTNVLLEEDLRRSHERLVVAREEERRRLRRDLHDGLGPVLTGAAMMIDAGRNLMRRDPDGADQQLSDARAQVKAAIDDIRRLVYGLRPPALDDLGLVGALQEQARNGPVRLSVDADGPIESLPAAVEVAAFRIVSEAVNNAVLHSTATACTVRISMNGALQLEILDNGFSTNPWRAGVGIISMRERAAELGGICDTGPASDGGGRVHAVIPVEVNS
ncbi:MAG: histidine kinase [Dehalococcoidia bacterium]